MTDQSIIASEIRARSAGLYDSWHIGVTQDPQGSRRFWDDTDCPTDLWTDWKANSIEEAKELASHFVVLGMIPGPSEDLAPNLPTYVYVF